MNYYNYFTEIEEHFVKRRGKHLLISPMDWSLIASWRDTGIPLQVALRGIDIAMDRFQARNPKGGARVNSLCYCHDSVMAEYGSHLESHVGESPQGTPEEKEETVGKAEVLELLQARTREIGTAAAGRAGEGLERVLSRLAETATGLQGGNRLDAETVERDLRIADELLVSTLRLCLAPDEIRGLEDEARLELKIYKKKLPRETYEKIRANTIAEKIRRRFGVGELTLFRL